MAGATVNGGHDDVRGAAPPLLVFGADGRLMDWTAGSDRWPGLAGRLAVGVPAAELEPHAAGRRVERLSGGGMLWRHEQASPEQSSPEQSSPDQSSPDQSSPDQSSQRQPRRDPQPGDAPAAMRDPAGRLFAAASHDLRQPLAALSLLIGTLDGVLDTAPGSGLGSGLGGGLNGGLSGGRSSGPSRGAADGSSRDLLRSMTQAVESMRSMVDGHFDLVRLESGLVEPEIRSHAVNGVLMRLALDVAPRIADRGLRFTVMPCSAMVRTDSALLERLLHGLVANALRATTRGRVLVGCRSRGDGLHIEVWDTGRGQSAERLAALREDLNRPAGEGAAALGLDLTLVRGLARRLGLGLEVRSTEGRGTVFVVVVPKSAEPADWPGEGLASGDTPGGGPGDRQQAGTADISQTRILVVEDDPMVLAALEALLGQWGCAVVGAESYDAAVRRIGPEPDPFDLIISDLRLKGAANGIVAIRQLAMLFDRPVPGMILTGDTDPKRLREARLSGYPLLHKPVAPLALRAVVLRLLGRDPP
ncbi:ATP-binding response regulator [Azospirillum picis]|uniref:histidine kinase n=1 Tax=Azospirillum picis TaxID=488438 RepID=A0ABU0MF69_9PROT|nr:hybrid sensor histidine kinase/response regulator [Azospirillum picis]MBP2298233.1 signal transduction histidine kinase/CheY-like chemotaxis protein [Azospirillum picis]MDQ0532071.1 signal transduction histidine kinase/CheY-like chemotaxis protein [Azospirillum picis]